MRATVIHGPNDIRIGGAIGYVGVPHGGSAGVDISQMFDLDGVPDGYRAMHDRTALKIRIAF